MIVRPRPRAYQLFFILKGSILRHVYGQILFVTGIAILASWWHGNLPHLIPEFSVAPMTLLGLTLSIFLGFRNNACYDRWWEGRKQWGALIVESRTLTRDLLALLPESEVGERGRELVLGTAAFAYALAAHLRGQELGFRVEPLLGDAGWRGLSSRRNVPDAILGLQARRLVQCRGMIPDILLQGLLERLTAMAAVLAACERIRNTPLPFAYTLLLHRTAYLFCALLPLGMVASLGWLTPLFAAIVAYTFFGLDALGDELEEPFGMQENDLPIDALARTIEINLREALGDTVIPEAVQPREFLLL